MHYRLFLSALALLAFAGCLESTTGPKTRSELLSAHAWKVTGFDLSGPAVLAAPITTLDFQPGGLYVLTALECTDRIGTWRLSADETTVRTTPGAPSEDDSETVWTILELTDTQLHVRAEQSDKGIVTEVRAVPK